MDFRLSEEQQALGALAREILAAEVTPERLKAVEASPRWFDTACWQRLAEANLLGLAVPESLGGMGMGFFELCVLLGEVGRAVAPVPALPALVLAGLPLARFGSELQQKEWLAPLARGECLLTGAFEPAPEVSARAEAGGLVLDGVRANVPGLEGAARVLVPARGAEGELLCLVDPGAAGVSVETSRSSRGERLSTLTLAGVHVAADDVLRGEACHSFVLDHARVALAATQVGVSERALEITTAYLKQREQFGAPLGALPPVQHRCADAYIALESLRGVMWLASWRLANGLPAHRDVAIASFWTAQAGSQIGTATQHLHGGMGVDLDYPIHRYFLWAKACELSLGAATPELLRLGRDMARSGPEELA